MSALADTMAPVHRLLRGELAAEQLAELFQVPASRALIYQSSARAHLDEVLAKNYASLRSVLGPALWQRICDGYFAEQPPSDFELNACVRALPGYLEQLRARGEPGIEAFHAELAELEWLEFSVYVSRSGEAAPTARTTLNPTLEILQTRFPVARFLDEWRAWEAGELESAPAPPLNEAPEVVFVFRHPASEEYAFARADPELLFAFKVLYDGLDPAAAAQAAGVETAAVERALDRALRLGLAVSDHHHQHQGGSP